MVVLLSTGDVIEKAYVTTLEAGLCTEPGEYQKALDRHAWVLENRSAAEKEYRAGQILTAQAVGNEIIIRP